jgi:alpha-beta hydrolase superfamily lysophospholipase
MAAGALPFASESEQRSPLRPPDRHGRLRSLGRRRWALVCAAGLALAALILGAAVSWHFSSRVLVPEHLGWPEDVRVEAVTPRSVVLERSEDTMRPGFYGLVWQAGHAIAGPVLASDESTVTRRLADVSGYLVPGLEVGLDTNVFSGNPNEGRGLPYASVAIDGELGPMPAWLIPAATPNGARPATPAGSWAIVVHGINADPQLGLRLAPTLRRAGLPSLLITYREDLGAPQSPDGFHHMGLTEWRDLQAAARYALSHGARRLLLVGYSMGGSLVTQFMQHSPLADRVAGLVLDAPALSWQAILSFNATEMGLPSFSSRPVEWAIGARIDADWDDLDALRHSEDLALPILLFHGTEDDLVPIGTSDELAEEIPEWVTYYRVARAGHTQSWNVNPSLYERRVRQFLAAALGKQRSGATTVDRGREQSAPAS